MQYSVSGLKLCGWAVLVPLMGLLAGCDGGGRETGGRPEHPKGGRDAGVADGSAGGSGGSSGGAGASTDAASGASRSSGAGGASAGNDAGTGGAPAGSHGGMGNANGPDSGTGGSNGGGGTAGGSNASNGLDGGVDGGKDKAHWSSATVGTGRCVATNSNGDVLGTDETGATFLLSRAGVRTALGSFAAGASTVGVALGANGNVVGYSESKTGRTAIAFENGAWSTLAGLTAPWSAAIGVGPQGEIVGVMGTQTRGQMRAFLYTSGALGTLPLPAAQNSAAYIAGTNGMVAGILETTSKQTHAFLVSGKAVRDLGTLGGSSSVPFGMNSNGDVVGAAQTADGTRHAFLVPKDKPMVDLGVPSGALRSEARGIDDQGHIVGNAFDASGASHPVVFSLSKDPVDLLPSDPNGDPFVAAYSVSMTADGRIVGWGTSLGSSNAALKCTVWTVTP